MIEVIGILPLCGNRTSWAGGSFGEGFDTFLDIDDGCVTTVLNVSFITKL